MILKPDRESVQLAASAKQWSRSPVGSAAAGTKTSTPLPITTRGTGVNPGAWRQEE